MYLYFLFYAFFFNDLAIQSCELIETEFAKERQTERNSQSVKEHETVMFQQKQGKRLGTVN